MMFERYTDEARRVVVMAQEGARTLRHNYIGTEHLLLGLLDGDTPASRALNALNITTDRVKAEIETRIGPGRAVPSGHIPFTPRSKKALEQALREALQLGHAHIGPEHILLGVAHDSEGVGGTILGSYNVTLDQLRKAVMEDLVADQGNKAGEKFAEKLATGFAGASPNTKSGRLTITFDGRTLFDGVVDGIDYTTTHHTRQSWPPLGKILREPAPLTRLELKASIEQVRRHADRSTLGDPYEL